MHIKGEPGGAFASSGMSRSVGFREFVGPFAIVEIAKRLTPFIFAAMRCIVFRLVAGVTAVEPFFLLVRHHALLKITGGTSPFMDTTYMNRRQYQMKMGIEISAILAA